MNFERCCSAYKKVVLSLILRVVVVIIFSFSFASCERSSMISNKSPDEIVESWKNLGMYLPSDKEVDCLSSHLPNSLQALKKGILHDHPHVRMCSADVIEKLGMSAKPLAQDMRAAYMGELEAINRVYFVMALASIEDNSLENIEFMKNAFATEKDIQVRTYLAGGILVLSGIDKNSEAWNWIVDSLATGIPPSKFSTEASTEYWERRWGASYMLGKLRYSASLAIPLLERLVHDEATPEWVKRRVKTDLTLISE